MVEDERDVKEDAPVEGVVEGQGKGPSRVDEAYGKREMSGGARGKQRSEGRAEEKNERWARAMWPP